MIYADTDSLKLQNGFNQNVINNYNNKVYHKIKSACYYLNLNLSAFEPKDKEGKKHRIGIFELDGKYKEFKTLGAKKYAYKDYDDNIHITVSGVPKDGAIALQTLNDFNDDFIFEFKDTNKLMIAYNDDMNEFNLKDYNGNKQKVIDKYGACLVPTTYKLGISEEYFNLIKNDSSNHAIFKESDNK